MRSTATVTPTAGAGSATIRVHQFDNSRVVDVRGDVDQAATTRLAALLDALDEDTASTLAVDLAAATASGPRLVRMLCRWHTQRQHTGRPTELRGLHPDVLPDFEDLDLTEMFTIYQAVHTAAGLPQPRVPG